MDKGKMDRDLADTSARKYACSNRKSGRKPKTKIASRKIQEEQFFDGLSETVERKLENEKAVFTVFSQFSHKNDTLLFYNTSSFLKDGSLRALTIQAIRINS